MFTADDLASTVEMAMTRKRPAADEEAAAADQAATKCVPPNRYHSPLTMNQGAPARCERA
jgi:hypothetical protein